MKKRILFGLLVAGLLVSFSALALAAAPAGKSLIKVGGSVIVEEGETVDAAVAIGGNVTVKGNVKESAVAIGGNVTVASGAIVEKDAVSIGGKVIKERGADIRNKVVEVGAFDMIPAMENVGMVVQPMIITGLAMFKLFMLIGFIALALVVVALFTRQLGLVSAQSEKDTWQSLWFGLLGWILVVPIIIVLAISIIGILFIPLFLLIFAVAKIFGYIAVAQLVGKKVTVYLKHPNQSMYYEVLVGVLLFGLIGFIPVIGGLIKIIAAIIGLGAVILTRFGSKACC